MFACAPILKLIAKKHSINIVSLTVTTKYISLNYLLYLSYLVEDMLYFYSCSL